MAIILVVMLSSIICGWLIASFISEKQFWDRQNFMEKINKMFI